MIKGATLGQYRLERLIHMGDSCQVWEATKLKTNELYALKVLRPDFRASRQKIALLWHLAQAQRDIAIFKTPPEPPDAARCCCPLSM